MNTTSCLLGKSMSMYILLNSDEYYKLSASLQFSTGYEPRQYCLRTSTYPDTYRHAPCLSQIHRVNKPKRMSEKFTVAKLTGSGNYASWAADLCIVLKHHRHWSWIEGNNEQPPPMFMAKTDPDAPDVDNPAHTVWEDGATDALYRIMMTCKSNVKDQIRQINVPSMVWKKLKDLYEPSNASTQFDYLSTIWTISLSHHLLICTQSSSIELPSQWAKRFFPPACSHHIDGPSIIL